MDQSPASEFLQDNRKYGLELLIHLAMLRRVGLKIRQLMHCTAAHAVKMILQCTYRTICMFCILSEMLSETLQARCQAINPMQDVIAWGWKPTSSGLL